MQAPSPIPSLKEVSGESGLLRPTHLFPISVSSIKDKQLWASGKNKALASYNRASKQQPHGIYGESLKYF